MVPLRGDWNRFAYANPITPHSSLLTPNLIILQKIGANIHD